VAEKLVSTRVLRDGLKELEEKARAESPYLPDFAAKRDERLILEFSRLVREAELEYLSSGAVHELTGWDPSTLRKYARKALAGDPMPEEWSRLVVRKDGKEYSFVLSSVPPKAKNVA
jgi:hypothetical protein